MEKLFQSYSLCNILCYLSLTEELFFKKVARSIYNIITCLRTINIGGVPCLSTTFKMKRFTYSRGYKNVRGEILSNMKIDTKKYYLKFFTKLGWAVAARKIIDRMTPLFPYEGEMIRTSERKFRQTKEKREMNYMLVIKEHLQYFNGEVNKKIVFRTNIDASSIGGIARFMSHSCDPNCEVFMLRNEEQGSIIGVPVIRSRRIIVSDEQLTFDYGNSSSTDDYSSPRKICVCGSDCCTGYLPFHPEESD